MFGDETRQADADAATPGRDRETRDDASFELTNEVDPMDAVDEDAGEDADVVDDPYDADLDDSDDAGDDADLDDSDDAVDEETDAAADDTDDDAEVPFEPAFDDRPVPEAPATGDTAIDEAMTELAVAQAGSFETRIEAGERAHRLLQGRLGGLGEA